MKKQQIVLIASAIILLCVVYFFGNTVPPKKMPAKAQAKDSSALNINTILQASKQQLTPAQQIQIETIEKNSDEIARYRELAAFYRDSAHLLLPFAYYTGEAAKLENSEKSLTFAARFFLENARSQRDQGLKNWMAGQSKELFEKALVLDPGNDSLKVGLGSCYIYGTIAENPMQGIMMIREVAERDSSNMYAQYMLGVGGLMSGQLDKAVERLSLVAARQPENVEVKLMLAEAFERKGDNANAVKWYESVKEHVNNPDIIHELDLRIQSLKK